MMSKSNYAHTRCYFPKIRRVRHLLRATHTAGVCWQKYKINIRPEEGTKPLLEQSNRENSWQRMQALEAGSKLRRA